MCHEPATHQSRSGNPRLPGRWVLPVNCLADAHWARAVIDHEVPPGEVVVLLHVVPVNRDGKIQERLVRAAEEWLLPLEKDLRRSHPEVRLVIAAGDADTELRAFATRPGDHVIRHEATT